MFVPKLLFRTCLVGIVLLTSCNRTALQVLRSSTDLTTTPDDTWVKTIREKPRARQVVLVDERGRRRHLPADSVWGYRTNRGDTFRLYGHDTYELVQRGPLLMYRTEEWIGDSQWENYYFSLNPDSAIHAVDKRTCRRVFANDGCMLQLISQMRNGQLLSTDAHGSYGLVNAYQYCHFSER